MSKCEDIKKVFPYLLRVAYNNSALLSLWKVKCSKILVYLSCNLSVCRPCMYVGHVV